MKKHLPLIFILLLAAVLRFYQLGRLPQSLNIDELGFAYNAYSVMTTGHDEWGNPFPASFRSLGDFKLPFHGYIMIPSFALFGFTPFAIRFPVALFSFLTVILIYHLTNLLFPLKSKPLPAGRQVLNLTSALLLALSPWHLFYSRFGYEAIIQVFFVTLHIYFLLRFIKVPSFRYLLGAFFAALAALLTYHSAKVFLPIFDLVFILTNHQSFLSLFKKNPRRSFAFFGLCLATAVIYLLLYMTGPAAERARMVFFTLDFDYQRILAPHTGSSLLPDFGPVLMLVLFWWKRLLEYFSPAYFIGTTLPLTSPTQIGQGIIYPIELLLLIIGLVYLVKDRRLSQIILPWWLISLLPATLANNSQHTLRNMVGLPALIIIISLGAYHCLRWFKYKSLLILISLYLLSLVRFADLYLVHQPQFMSQYQGFGWQQMAEFVADAGDKYDLIYIDPRVGISGPETTTVPYLYFLYYTKVAPKDYIFDTRRKIHDSNFGRLRFEQINWFGSNHSLNNLYIGSPFSFPLKQIDPEKIRYTVTYPGGQTALYAISDK